MAASSSTLFSCRAPTVSVQSMCEQEFEFGTFRPCTISPNLGNDMFTVHCYGLTKYLIQGTLRRVVNLTPYRKRFQRKSYRSSTRQEPTRFVLQRTLHESQWPSSIEEEINHLVGGRCVVPLTRTAGDVGALRPVKLVTLKLPSRDRQWTQ